MLLPSDVARLVLGYLQQEKLTSTCRSFIAESPSLKEYAEHHTEDGSIPGCLLSLFGKNLTTILNEYITMKAKEHQAEIPFMVSSLWKKLDLTLSQIRSMQESAAFNNHQRARTRKGINDRLRQRMLTSPLAVSGSPAPQPVIHQTSTPIMATQYILQPLNTPGALQPIACPSFGGESTVQNIASTSVSIVEPAPSSSTAGTQKKTPPAATASPMRRKQDIQRRRRAAQLSSTTIASDGDVCEDVDTLQAIVDNDLSQMVIENAREKILSNKSLQEKLAENINKFLGSDSTAQSTKQSDGTTAEQDPSIDEILGLQGGEMHMSEEAISDILTQTELDPDFQELYDLFACVTSKNPKVTTRESSTRNNDPKTNVTEKGKKQDVVERLLDVESGSTECAKETNVCSKGKEAANLPVQNIEKSSEDQTSQLPSTSKACADGNSSSEHQTSSYGNQNASSIENSEGDMVMDTSTDLLVAEVVVESHGQDTEMEDIPSKEDAAYGFHMDSLPTDIVVSDKSTSSATLRTVNGDVKDSEVISNGSLQDASECDPVISSLTNVPGTPQKENKKHVTRASTSPSNKPCNSSTNLQDNAVETVTTAAKDQTAQNAAVDNELAACPGQISVALETAALCSSVPSTSQTDLDDSSIVTLNILTEGLPEDTELHSAVQSIDGENYATIILSPLVKSQDLKIAMPSQDNAIIDLTDSPVVGQQAELVTQSSDGTASLFQTPPRPGSVYTVGQTMSPKLSQGSTIILASPIQPVLQGVVGMFPVSLVGQGGSTFTAPSHQILHVPVSKPIVPKLPLPRAQKPALLKSNANTGKSSSNSAADTSSGSSSSVGQRLVNEGKRSESESINKPDDSALPDSTNAAAKEVEAHRRVLCFDGSTSAAAKLGSPSSTNIRSQKTDRKDSVHNVGSSEGSASSSRASVSKENQKTESAAPSGGKNPKASATSSASTKEQAAEKRPAAPCDGALGNKENVLQVEAAAPADKRSNTPESEKNAKRPQETGKKSTSLPNILRRTPQKAPSERVCPTSPLVRQASQLLQGMQFQSPTSKQPSQGDLAIPPTPGSGLDDKPLDNHIEQTRTPTSKRYDDGGTPKPMLPPATPDLPTCSPASEAGSENSVNMAAHTLMILSRATLAKSSGNTPLKDNTQQIKSSKSSSKKRKLDETEEFERPTHKKDHISPATSQKKRRAKKQRKKSMDNFPAGMDVDKFLMSLHYDE
ncbi:protein NPAT isoform X1 [Hyla sarda]|uniref:protein NPAT isoform X1 n=1 Tax=Hyla sarda TaxID=327740 RepID=UPI0024C2F35B|nr:protein NPAT isoform X1 [Hyla sarda]